VRLGNTTGHGFSINDDGYVMFELACDWDSSTAIEMSLHVYINEAYATRSGEIRFQADWSAIAEDVNNHLLRHQPTRQR